ncbi:MAG: oligosaccharide flippase family protein [bacterium]|nr:oligosaccharide flippase family protein [bacterium]
MTRGAGLWRDLGVLAAGQGAAQLLNLAALVVLARALGGHWFGVLQVAAATSAYVLLAAEAGLFTLGVRDLARLDPRDHAGARDLVARRAGLLLLLALAAGLLGSALLPWFGAPRQDPRLLWLYLAGVLPQALMADWVVLGLGRPAWAAAARTVRSLVAALLVLLVFGRTGEGAGAGLRLWGPLSYLAGFFAGNLVAAAGAARALGARVGRRGPTRAAARGDLAAAAPLGAANLMRRVLFNIDLVVLGLLATPAEAGRYAAASRLAFVLVTVTESSLGAVLPRLAGLHRRDPAGYRRGLRRVAARVVPGLAALAAAGVLFGGPLVRRLFGEAFAGSAAVFAVLVVGYAALALALLLHESLVAEDRQAAGLPPLAAGAALAAAGAAVAAPLGGAAGVAWAMAAAHLIYAAWLAALALAPRPAARRDPA